MKTRVILLLWSAFLSLMGQSIEQLPFWPRYEHKVDGEGALRHYVLQAFDQEYGVPQFVKVLGYRTSDVMRGDIRYARVDFLLKAEAFQDTEAHVRPLLSAASYTVKNGLGFWADPSPVQVTVLEADSSEDEGAQYILRVEGSRRLLIEEFVRNMTPARFIHTFEKLRFSYSVIEKVSIVPRSGETLTEEYACGPLEQSYSQNYCPLHAGERRLHLVEQPCGRLPWEAALEVPVQTPNEVPPRIYFGASCGASPVEASNWQFQEWMTALLRAGDGLAVEAEIPMLRTFDVEFEFVRGGIFKLTP